MGDSPTIQEMTTVPELTIQESALPPLTLTSKGPQPEQIKSSSSLPPSEPSSVPAQNTSNSVSCLKNKIFYDHGEVTAYGTNPTGGHCGFKELPSDQAKKYFVAISSQDTEGWKDGLYCGSCVRLKYTDGKELIGYIHDSCPSCPKYHWDLSDYMYLDLTNEQSVGIKDISDAEIVECPDNIVSGNMKVKIKEGSNPWWAAYQVLNTKNPINGMSMSTDGGVTWVEMVGPEEPAPSGFWFMKPDGLTLNADNGMENYKIRVESDTGDIVVDMVGVVDGGETDSGTNNAAQNTSNSASCLKDKIFYDHGEVTAYGTNPTGGHCGFKELPSEPAAGGTQGWAAPPWSSSCTAGPGWQSILSL